MPSEFADGGILHVVPAVGANSEANPANVLAKISRAYVERTDEKGNDLSFLDRTRMLLTKLSEKSSYDAIFVDARAGLNEATAGVLLGLGAEILLFGINTPQTFSGYRFLLSHLGRFRPAESGDRDWRYRLHMVHAKAGPSPTEHASFRTQAFELFADTIYDQEEGVEANSFNFDYDDQAAPHFALTILDDSNFSEFDPLARSDQVSRHFYDRTFGQFITGLAEKIGLRT